MEGWSRRAAMGALASSLVAASRARAGTTGEQDAWPALAAQIFEGRTLEDGTAVVAIDAPYRAEDAAVVPIALRTLLQAGDPREVRKLTLVIDANPSPLAVTFTLGAGSHVDSIATRVRVDDYTTMHAIAELSDDKLYVASRFVKAAGGCSAPALTLTADAVPFGTMRFRLLGSDETHATGGSREAQVMIRHPNYSGMQMNQLTRLYIPARFVQTLRVWQGERMLFSAESGISISENPSFRFDYRPNGAKEFRIEATDSTGKTFHDTFPVATAS